MTKRYENTIARVFETVSEKTKNEIRLSNATYSKEFSDLVGFGNVATYIFKSLTSKQRGELINCATENKLMTGEATNKRVFYLIKRICEVA